jgi:hypothetical protein
MEKADLRGDAVIYLWNQADVDGAIGYHSTHSARGIPFGFVFTEIARSLGEPWSVTLSHEALELIADPETNLLVMGPHPIEDRDVFYWYEMCDAVQTETYEIDGVAVSNFLLPLYFTGTRDFDEVGARNDFLGRVRGASPPLTSFGVKEGGYIGFFDPQNQRHEVIALTGDFNAQARYITKGKAKEARRAVRYRDPESRDRVLRAMGQRSKKGKRAEPRQYHLLSATAPAAAQPVNPVQPLPGGNGHTVAPINFIGTLYPAPPQPPQGS